MPENIGLILILLAVLAVLLLLRLLVTGVEDYYDLRDEGQTSSIGETLVALIIAFPAMVAGLRSRLTGKKA